MIRDFDLLWTLISLELFEERVPVLLRLHFEATLKYLVVVFVFHGLSALLQVISWHCLVSSGWLVAVWLTPFFFEALPHACLPLDLQRVRA